MDLQDAKALDLNRAQLRFLLSKPSSATSIWGRGTGKSFVIAVLMDRIVKELPRSFWAIVGQTYQQILTRTLPSTVAALELLGYHRNVHYFIGRKAPDNYRWKLPYQSPLKYDHFIHFINGTGFALVSQDSGGGSARGLNLDGAISDETLLMDKQQYDDEVSPTLRANKNRFGHLRLHRGHFHFTSMPYGDNARWLLDQSNYLLESYDFQSLTSDMIDLQLKFVDSRDRQHRLNLWKDIAELQKQLRFYPNKDGLLYSEANVFDNLANIPLAYLQEQRTVLTHFTFMTEVLNKRPGSVEAGFYPMLDLKHHAYDRYNNDYLNGLEFDFSKLKTVDSRMDGDCEPKLPLRISVDWGARISTLLVAQHIGNEYRFIKGMYVKHPKLIDDLVKDFTEYYSHHQNKTVHFIQDNEWGNRRLPNSPTTFNMDFAQKLRAKGWIVRTVDLGRTPEYGVRYHIALDFLKVRDRLQQYPLLQFNRHNCKDVLTAMSLAPIRQNSKGQIEKNKNSERRTSTPAEEATHFTDCLDLHLLSIGRHHLAPAPDTSDLLTS